MKISLDESVTKHLKPFLSQYEVFTVREMNWGGIKNGRLMSLCVENHFDILLTIDKNIWYQQNLHKYPLAIVILNCLTSKIEEIKDYIINFKLRVQEFEKYNAYLLNK